MSEIDQYVHYSGKVRAARNINFEAWSRTLIGFIRDKGLEQELKDWSGGWPCPIGSGPNPVGWQPIETAPKDGTTILLYCPQGDGNPGSTYRVTVGDWCEDYGGITEHRDLEGRWIGQDESEGFIGWLSWDGGFSEDTMMPSHWQPLPSPPAPLDSTTETERGE